MSTGAKSALLILALLLLPAGAILRPDRPVDIKWYEDFAQAQKMAAQQGKDLLVDFTGSDWCLWCIKLVEEVFSREHFQKEAPQNFILVKLDYPRDRSKMSQEIIEQNERLLKEYLISGYPTIYLMDAGGRPYALTGYQEGGPEKYIENLAKLQNIKAKRDEFIAQTRDKVVVEDGQKKTIPVEPVKKAQLLDQALSVMDDDIVDKFYPKEIEQIIEFDADNAAGLKAKYQLRLRLGRANQAIDNRQYKEGADLMDAIVKDLNLSGESLQQVLYAKGRAYYSLKDMAALEKCLRDAYHAASQGKLAETIKKQFERFFPGKDIIKKI